MNGEDTNIAIFRELGEIKESLGSQSTNIQNLRNELTGPGGRITTMEDRIEKSENRQWWHSAILIPTITFLHTILHKLGLPI